MAGEGTAPNTATVPKLASVLGGSRRPTMSMRRQRAAYVKNASDEARIDARLQKRMRPATIRCAIMQAADIT